jgi:PTS system mannose-specific IID component
MEMNKKSVLTKKDLRWSLMFMNAYQGWCMNYETMQSAGWTFALGPLIEKIYEGDDDLIREKLLKHLQFYNCNPWTNLLVAGAVLSIEESREEGCTDTAIALRTGLMGPMAGVGDSLFFINGKVIFDAMAGYMALQGNLAGMWIAILVGFLCFVMRYQFFWMGYKQGIKFVTNNRVQLQLLTNVAVIMGLVVVGAMIPSMVSFKMLPSFTFGAEGQSVLLSDWINGIIPQLVPVLITGTIYVGLKQKWMTTVRMVWLLIATAILLTLIGFI